MAVINTDKYYFFYTSVSKYYFVYTSVGIYRWNNVVGNVSQRPIVEEEPNADAKMVFDLLKYSDEPLWDGCTNHNKLLAVV
jgi:hypothetical protein